MANQFNIEIKGYWRDKNKAGIPSYPGIFLVYETKYNIETDTVTLIRLLYIGEATNIQERIINHKLYQEWSVQVRVGNELAFSAARVEGNVRTIIKAAFIYKFKPIVNTDYKDSFPFEETSVNINGRTNLLAINFLVARNN